MEAKELRIGNYAVYGGSVTRMDVGEFIHFVRFPETYSPVLLTEEWLLKFAFEKSIHGEWYHPKLFGWLTKYTKDEGLYCYNAAKLKICEIKYVHQLQNLYFALTGEELSAE